MEKQSYPKKTYTIRNKTEKVKISGLNTVSVRTQNTKTSIKVHKLKNNKKLSSKKHHHRVKKTSSQGQNVSRETFDKWQARAEGRENIL